MLLNGPAIIEPAPFDDIGSDPVKDGKVLVIRVLIQANIFRF